MDEDYFSGDDEWNRVTSSYEYMKCGISNKQTWDHTQFHARLEQGREATPGDDLGVHLMEAFQALRSQP